MKKRLPSEERKWLQYYNGVKDEDDFSEYSLYEAIHHVDDESRKALSFFGISISYKKLYEYIDMTAKAFFQNGIRKGDVVMLMLPTLPESIYCFYALNKIGAVSNMVDVRSTPSRVVEIAKKTRPKMLVVMSFYLKQLETVRRQLDLEKIVVLRGCDTMPSSVTFWYKLAEHFNGRRKIINRSPAYSFWPEFLATGLKCKIVQNENVVSNETAVIYQTSGTTGFPKSVLHINESLNYSVRQRFKYLNNPQSGDTILSILPIFTLFGFVYSIHMPLLYGMTILIVPYFKPNQMSDLIRKNKPNFIFGVPSHWEEFAEKQDGKGDMSFIKDIIVAGEVIDRNLRLKVNKLLHDNKSQASIRVDYGMTEIGGTISLMMNNATDEDSCNNGYSGVPLPYLIVCIYDNEAKCELGYNCKGEICVQTPCALKEYLLDKTETENLRRKHPDGSEWIHTGDIGYLTEKGHLYVIGRSKRMIVRYDGTKLFPIEMESVIRGVDGVGECSVVPIADPNHSQGGLPFVFVVSDGTVNPICLRKDIIKQCTLQLPVFLQPYEVRVVEQLPHNSMGKIDYRKLIEMI